MLRLLAARTARGSKRRERRGLFSWPLPLPLNLFSSSRDATTTTTAAVGIEAAYAQAVESGALRPDDSQRRAVEQLALLQHAVVGRSRQCQRRRREAEEEEQETRAPPPQRQQQQQQQGRPPPPPSDAPPLPTPPAPTPACLGAYLWGDVGTGKTALADLFLRTLPPDVPRRREHFHPFMLSFHRRQHELLEALPKVAAPTRQGGGAMRVWRSALPEEDPILTAAREIALDGGGGSVDRSAAVSAGPPPAPPPPTPTPLAVLCLDELHVTDVADAMTVSRLFSALMLEHGVAVLFTSNRPPGRLYEGGLSRLYFLPFVELCESRLLGLRLLGQGSGGGGEEGEAGGLDYRRQQQQARVDGGKMFVGPGARAALERAWEAEQGEEGKDHRPDVSSSSFRLPVPAAGRDLAVPRALLLPRAAAAASSSSPAAPHGRRLAAARFSFEELCGGAAALSSADYCALVEALAATPTARGGGGGGGEGAGDGEGGALFVDRVPVTLCPRAQRDEARRLVTLLDVLCDAWAQRQSGGGAGGGGAAAMAPPRLVLALEGEGGGGGPDSLFEALARERAEQGEAGVADDQEDEDGGLPASLRAEEALMYRRAASRLAGLADVVDCSFESARSLGGGGRQRDD